jgi:hypothetical protein
MPRLLLLMPPYSVGMCSGRGSCCLVAATALAALEALAAIGRVVLLGVRMVLATLAATLRSLAVQDRDLAALAVSGSSHCTVSNTGTVK